MLLNINVELLEIDRGRGLAQPPPPTSSYVFSFLSPVVPRIGEFISFENQQYRITDVTWNLKRDTEINYGTAQEDNLVTDVSLVVVKRIRNEDRDLI